MINLKNLEFSFVQEDWKNTFVGIRKDKSRDAFIFQLPKGFETFPISNYKAVKSLFFNTFKTYRRFFRDKQKLAEENPIDGFEENTNGFTLVDKDGCNLFYSKLNMLDSILDSYNELQILNLKNKLSKSNSIDYSKIDKYLDKATYIDEDTVYIDEMDLPKRILQIESPPLVQLFCFIYTEIKYALDEIVESDRAISLSNEFRESYLTHDSSIFDEETFDETMVVLKDVLDEIDRKTGYKDEDYWNIFESIHKFLYGENENSEEGEEIIWGITNFSIIWEELCYNEAIARLTKNKLLFADRIGKTESHNGFISPFFFQLNITNPHKRKIRPDLVYTEFDGEIEHKTLEKIFVLNKIVIWDHENISLKTKYSNHDYYEIDSIYQKYLRRNRKHLENPHNERFRNVLAIDVDEMLDEISTYISEFDLSSLLKKKPCLVDFILVDYKYIAESTCKAGQLNDERRQDIKKQLVYEYALQLNFPESISRSEFWIPFYFDNSNLDFVEVKYPNINFVSSKIKVFKRNFFKLQRLYIQQNG